MVLFTSGRLFATGEISVDGMWSHHDSDEDEDECQVVNAIDYFHGVFFSQVRLNIESQRQIFPAGLQFLLCLRVNSASGTTGCLFC